MLGRAASAWTTTGTVDCPEGSALQTTSEIRSCAVVCIAASDVHHALREPATRARVAPHGELGESRPLDLRPGAVAGGIDGLAPGTGVEAGSLLISCTRALSQPVRSNSGAAASQERSIFLAGRTRAGFTMVEVKATAACSNASFMV
jgi:hypothetical protein